MRSYTTGRNEDTEAPDNDFGDLIIADLNFDGKEDFSVKADSGGNSGPQYYFYLQDAMGDFILDRFLSNEMHYFPSSFDPVKKTLTTFTHAGYKYTAKRIFKLDTRNKRWKLLKHKLLKAGEYD